MAGPSLGKAPKRQEKGFWGKKKEGRKGGHREPQTPLKKSTEKRRRERAMIGGKFPIGAARVPGKKKPMERNRK